MSLNSKNNPLVSIIIPAFNAEKYISQTINSILEQSYENIEIIIVDDGSTDNTLAIINKFSNKVRCYYQENSGGCSSPRNNGFKHAKGLFVHFFDADDLMLSGNIEGKVKFLIEYPLVGFVCSDFINFRLVGHIMKKEDSHFSTCPIFQNNLESLSINNEMCLSGHRGIEIMLDENFSNAGSTMYRKEVFEQVGMFDERLKSTEDFDLIYRVLLKYDIGIINSIGFYRRLHDSNITTDPIKMSLNTISSAKKLIKLENNQKNRWLLKKIIINSLFGLARCYRGTKSKLSLKYCLKSLSYINAFDIKIWVRFFRNIMAALLMRKP